MIRQTHNGTIELNIENDGHSLFKVQYKVCVNY